MLQVPTSPNGGLDDLKNEHERMLVSRTTFTTKMCFSASQGTWLVILGGKTLVDILQTRGTATT